MESDRLWEIIEEECALLQNRLRDHQELAGRYEARMDKPDFPDPPKDDFLIECLARYEARQEINLDLAEKAVAYFGALAKNDPVHAKHINKQMNSRAGDYELFSGRVFFKMMLRKPEWPDKKITAIFCPMSVVDGMVRPASRSGLEVQGAMSMYLSSNKGRTTGGTQQINLDAAPDNKPIVMEHEAEFPGLVHVKIQGVMGRPGDNQRAFVYNDQTLVITEEDLTPPLKRINGKSRRAKPRRDLKKAV